MTQTPEVVALDLHVSHDLAKLLARYPLPHGVPDVAMNQAELAVALQVSTNTIGTWVRRSMLCSEWRDDAAPFLPVTETGGPGRAYVFQLSHVYAWQSHRRALDDSRSKLVHHAQAALQASFLGLDPLDAASETLDPKARRALAEADMVHNQAAQMRRRLVKLDEVTDMLESVLQIVRDGIEGMPDRLERELGLRAEQVALVNRIGRDILNNMADRIEEAELRERDLTDTGIGEPVLI